MLQGGSNKPNLEVLIHNYSTELIISALLISKKKQLANSCNLERKKDKSKTSDDDFIPTTYLRVKKKVNETSSAFSEIDQFLELTLIPLYSKSALLWTFAEVTNRAEKEFAKDRQEKIVQSHKYNSLCHFVGEISGNLDQEEATCRKVLLFTNTRAHKVQRIVD